MRRMESTEPELAELEDFALELGNMAGSTALAYFRKPFDIDNKDSAGFDPVTSADRAIESVLRQAILDRYPDHGIVAEEEGVHIGDAPYTWFIDPIDGTKAVMMGSPLWGTLVGLTRREQPVFGLLCQPVLGEVFIGLPGASWLVSGEGRTRLRARHCTELANATLACTHPSMFDAGELTRFDALAGRCLLHRFGGDCYNYAMLAAGFVDLVVEAQLKPYDIVPLIPILEGAGSTVTNWRGEPPVDGGRVVAAATPELHAQALAVLAG
jgi:myo-inositol-1(or 4)-monophosphatase